MGMLKAALAKLACQEEYIVKYREMNKNDVSQLDTQAGQLKRRKEESETSSGKENVLLNQIEKIKGSMNDKLNETSTSVKNSYRATLGKVTKLVNDIITYFKNQIEKVKAIKMCKGQDEDETQEEKDEELEAVKSRYQAFLEKVTKLINDIIAHFNEQTKKIKEKSSEMHKSFVEKKDTGLENFNNKLRELFEKIANATVEPFKHICKDRGEKENALLTSEEDICDKEDKCAEDEIKEKEENCDESESAKEDTSANVVDVVKENTPENVIDEVKESTSANVVDEVKEKASANVVDEVKEDISANIGDAVKSDYGDGVLKKIIADGTDVI